MKICPVESELSNADKRTDKRIDMTKLTVALSNLANAPKMSGVIVISSPTRCTGVISPRFLFTQDISFALRVFGFRGKDLSSHWIENRVGPENSDKKCLPYPVLQFRNSHYWQRCIGSLTMTCSLHNWNVLAVQGNNHVQKDIRNKIRLETQIHLIYV